ncbi:unnamed protein product [Allacma fusca]|uniref:Uncharacterized protein n=1 Tax=Allacma fusca TaxID=39272 RepID=A0A8J2PE61_9HEXA|nr:unnamed protein product [Allacma fusca]
MNISSKVYSKRHVRRKRKLKVEIQMQRFEVGSQATFSEDDNLIQGDSDNGSGTDLSSSEEECTYSENTLREFICQWTSGHKIPHNAVSELLQHLKNNKEFSLLPRDARTILKTPRSTDIKIMSPGKYVHFGIEKILFKYYTKLSLFLMITV